MYDKLCGCPQTIEAVSDLKEYMSTLQYRIESLSGKIRQSGDHFNMMETSEWQISSEQMDVRWEVYRWPNRMATEVNKQEKYMRILEVLYCIVHYLHIFFHYHFIYLPSSLNDEALHEN